MEVKHWRDNLKALLPALPALPAVGAFVVYVTMLPDAITAANYSKDGGDFLAAALTGGVPHPSGYPTYTLLLRLFLGLANGSDYFKGSLLSGVAAALAVLGLSYLIAYRMKFSWAGIVGAVAGGISLAFAPLFWSQAVVVEVQALQAFFIVLGLWWVAMLEEEGFSKRKRIGLLGLALGFGLGVGNHLTILFMFPLVLIAARKAVKGGLATIWIAGQGIALLAGCAVYLYLPIAAQPYPPINWGNPQTLAGFWWMITGALYHGMVFGVTPEQGMERLSNLGSLLIGQFTIGGVLAAGVGTLWDRSNSKLLDWGMGWVFGIFCIFYLTFSSNDAIVYLIGAWVAVSGWIGNGIRILWDKKIRSVPWGRLASLVIMGVLIGQIPEVRAAVDPMRDTVTPLYLELVAERAPENAIVLTAADADTFPLWYSAFGKGLRKDLRIIVLPLTQYAWYQETIRHTYPDLVYPPMGSAVEAWEGVGQLNPGRAVCASELVGGESR